MRAYKSLLAVVLVITACSAHGAGPLQLYGVDYLGDLPTLIIDEYDLLARHDRELAISYGSSGKENLARLRTGQADFALMALTPLVLDRLADTTPAQADDPVIITSLVHSTQLNKVVTLESSAIRTPAQLQGKRIGLMKGTNAEFVWWLFAAYHQIDASSVEVIDIHIKELPAALVAGDIDAAVMWEPQVTRLHVRDDVSLFSFPKSSVYTAKWVLVTRRDIVQHQPGDVRAVLVAYQQAIEIIEHDPVAALQLYADKNDLDKDELLDSWQTLAYDVALDWSIIATLQQQIHWAVSTGYRQQGMYTDILGMLAPDILRDLAPAAIGIPRLAHTPDMH